MLDLLLLAAGIGMGCGGAPMDQQVPVQQNRRIAQQIDTLGVEGAVAGPAEAVWAALPAVYAEFGLEINFREPGPKRTGACYQRVHGRLGKELLSTFVDCGDSRSVPNADRFDVALTVLTTVVPISNKASKVFTFVLGAGNDPTSSNARIWCYSKGALEARIQASLEHHLAG